MTPPLSQFPRTKQLTPLSPGEMRVTRLSAEDQEDWTRRQETSRLNALLREPSQWHLSAWLLEHNITSVPYDQGTAPRTSREIVFAEDESPATSTGIFNLGDDLRNDRERAERLNIGREVYN